MYFSQSGSERFEVIELEFVFEFLVVLFECIPPSPLLAVICLGQQEVTLFSFSTALGLDSA